MRAKAWGGLTAAGVMLSAGLALAEPEPAPGRTVPEAPTSPKRAMPDYDGRGEPPTTAGDVALWIPRVVFSPIYFVTEYMIRRPLGWLIGTAERKQWPQAIRDFFLFGPQKKAGVVPTAFVDFGFRASFGIYAFWDDLFVKDNHLRLHATTYGKDWLSGAIADRIPIGNESTVDFRLEGVHRPDQIFAGIGPRTQEYQRTRNGVDRFEAHPVFEADACCDEPSLVSEVRAGRATLPRGFEGYTNLYQRGDFTIDTREARPADQTGLRLELEAEHGSNIRTSTANWVRYGGSVGGFVDIENNRTISLSVTTLFVDPMSSGARIPFTENIILGGSGPMRGYLLGRLNDRSAAIATVKYPLADLGISRRHAAGRNGQRVRTAAREFQACAPSSLGRDRHREHRRGGSHLRALGGRRERDLEQRGSIDSFRLLFGTNRGF